MVRTTTHLDAPSSPPLFEADFGSPSSWITPQKETQQQQQPDPITGRQPPEPDSPPELVATASQSSSTSTAATSDTAQEQLQHASATYSTNNNEWTTMSSSKGNDDNDDDTIEKLRNALDESSQRDATAKAALAKSDAVILELRSTVRQLKRQVDKKNEETKRMKQQQEDASGSFDQPSRGGGSTDDQQQTEAELASLRQELAGYKSRDFQNSAVGELQVQLDRAHGQLLTADMVRKELEDTLEAEQYTWELRVQDQDRIIQSLQQTCDTLQQDLNETRAQWSEAEQGWSLELRELQQELESSQRELTHWKQQQQQQDTNDGTSMEQLQQKITTLEQERVELQACLDEAMQELEAVDAEIQSAQVWQSERDALLEENARLQSLVEGGGEETATSPNNKEKGASEESLRDLARWVQDTVVERGGDAPQARAVVLDPENDDVDVLVQGVQDHVEALHLQLESSSSPAEGKLSPDEHLAKAQEKVAELEAQLSVYRGDLQAREESSAELRASLKEAVALLKPLQEVVDKTEQEKLDLLQELERLEQQQMDRLSKSLDMEDNTSQQQQQQKEHEEIVLELEKSLEELVTRDEQVKRLEAQVESLSMQLAEQKIKSAVANVAASSSRAVGAAQPTNEEGHEKQRSMDETNSKLEKTRQDLRAKRQSERALKQLLKDAQTKFNKINQHNREVEGENQFLAEKLTTAEKQLQAAHSFDNSDNSAVARELNAEMREAAIQQLEQDVKGYREELERKEKEVIQVKEELHVAQEEAVMSANDYKKMQEELQQAREEVDRVEELDTELSIARRDLKAKKKAEQVLNKSLKDALRLLQPLQSHLETAEREKKALSKELKTCKRRLARLEHEGDDAQSRSVLSHGQSVMSRSVGLPPEVEQAREELEKMVDQLEDENSRLQDALDDISINLSMTAEEVAQLDSQSPTKLKENFVELKSRYEVTKNRLDNSTKQKSQLLDNLKKKEISEKEMTEELNILRERLKKSDEELENAKYIATSALVKVEEMTMAAVEKEMTMSKPGSNAGSSKVGSNVSTELAGNAEESVAARNLKMKVQSLEREVQNIKQMNTSRGEAIRQRDQKLSAGPHSVGPRSAGPRSTHSGTPSWSPNDDFEWDEFSRVLEETHSKLRDKRTRSPNDTTPSPGQLHPWDNKLRGAQYGEEDRYVF